DVAKKPQLIDEAIRSFGRRVLIVGRNVVPDEVVRPSEPEANPLGPHRQTGLGNRIVRFAHPAQREVVVEDVEALRSVLGCERTAVVVVADVVLDAAVVAAVNSDAPLELRLDRTTI